MGECVTHVVNGQNGLDSMFPSAQLVVWSWVELTSRNSVLLFIVVCSVVIVVVAVPH